MAQEPGVAFNYNTGNSQLASAILAARAGTGTEAFAARHLFEPLGITEWRWNRDPSGVSIGGFGLYLRPGDMARIGLLYLQRGEWNGRQVIPRAWVDKVFQARLPMDLTPGTGYRYADGWWTLPARKAYMAVGYRRQMVMVLPAQGLVVATTGRSNYPIEALLDHLEAVAIAPHGLPANPAAAQALAAAVQAVAVAATPAQPATASPLAAAVAGRTWKAERNDLRVTQFRLDFGASAGFELETQGGPGSTTTRAVYRFDAAGRPMTSVSPRGPAQVQVRWIDESTLSLHSWFIEDAEAATFVLRFDGARVAVEYVHSNGLRTRFAAVAED
jgi:hypothetical protein